jgi:hypothetical protein
VKAISTFQFAQLLDMSAKAVEIMLGEDVDRGILEPVGGHHWRLTDRTGD